MLSEGVSVFDDVNVESSPRGSTDPEEAADQPQPQPELEVGGTEGHCEDVKGIRKCTSSLEEAKKEDTEQ